MALRHVRSSIRHLASIASIESLMRDGARFFAPDLTTSEIHEADQVLEMWDRGQSVIVSYPPDMRDREPGIY